MTWPRATRVSEDGLTWTVTIRDDVSFTDGEPLTAEDVAFTYNTVKEASSVNDFTMLDYAEAVDDTTVVFHMTTALLHLALYHGHRWGSCRSTPMTAPPMARTPSGRAGIS